MLEVAAMILDKPRALIFAGVLCLAAACGGARAAEVYPGCAEPGPIGKVWYVDPVNGKTPAEGGNGSRAAPWNSLAGLVASTPQPGYARPLLSSIPYRHARPLAGTTQLTYADEAGAIVHPGDELLLMSGNYGDIFIGTYGTSTTNSAFVTVAAAPGQTPVLSSLRLWAANMWRFQHLSVQSFSKTKQSRLVFVSDQGALTASDIIFESMLIGSPESVDEWTQADWVAKAHYSGFTAMSGPDGLKTKCVSFTGGKIYGTRYAAGLFSHQSVFSHNNIDHFGDDGLDYGANDLLISDNYIHDNLDIGDGNHPDCIQGFLGPINRETAPKNANGVPYTAYSNVVIERNRCIRQTDPKLKFPYGLQGIDAFDSDWTNLTVVNNVVVTSACWGVSFASVHGGKIINNTVLDDGSDTGTKNPAGKIMCRPSVAVGDKSHQGLSSNDVTIRNNIANAIKIIQTAPSVTLDHNICLMIDNGCQIVTYPDGKLKIVYKPGQYGDHNIVERRGAGAMFVDFDPARFAFDLNLKPGALAIGTGNPAGAPAVDITGAPRSSPTDIGAYQYRSAK
jgi:Right handed beta helix region